MLPDKKKHCLSKAEKYELNILPLKELYLYRIILKYYYNKNLLQPIKNTRDNRVRTYKQYKIPTFFNKYGERTTEVQVPKILSKIPTEFINLQSFREAKGKIKLYLLKHLNAGLNL